MSPLRTCIGCRLVRPADALVRLVLNDGCLVVGRALPGRGAWLCRSPAAQNQSDDLQAAVTGCRTEAVRRRALPRAFRTAVAAAEVERLMVPPT